MGYGTLLPRFERINFDRLFSENIVPTSHAIPFLIAVLLPKTLQFIQLVACLPKVGNPGTHTAAQQRPEQGVVEGGLACRHLNQQF